jgi:peptidoglycan hydrolase-like protein with peptidoglycan-binding domain
VARATLEDEVLNSGTKSGPIRTAQTKLNQGDQNLLSVGSKGQSVADLQQQLTDLGYDVGGVDGDYGQKTKAAVEKFQRDSGISVDAIAGPQTFAALLQAGNKGQATTQTSQTQPGGAPTGAPTTNTTWNQGKEDAETTGSGASYQGGNQGQAPGATTVGAGNPGGAGVTTVPASVQNYVNLAGNPQNLNGVLAAFKQILGGSGQVPYEGAIRDLIGTMPRSGQVSSKDMLSRAREAAGLIIDPQRLALNQTLQSLESQATTRRGNIEAAYQGIDEQMQDTMADLYDQSLKNAISRGGGRATLPEYTYTKLGQPVVRGYAQQMADKASALAELENALSTGQMQIGQQLALLGQQEGSLINQQYQGLLDQQYGRQGDEWSRALQATMGLATLGNQGNQFNQNVALSLIPYILQTQDQRVRTPMDWAGMMYEVPDMGGGTQAQNQGMVPLRDFAAQQGLGNMVNWDSASEEVIVGDRRIPLSELEKWGGYEQGGITYMPQAMAKYLLGVG